MEAKLAGFRQCGHQLACGVGNGATIKVTRGVSNELCGVTQAKQEGSPVFGQEGSKSGGM